MGNLPIAPYPTSQDLYRMRMEELQKILQTSGTFKEELMQAFLSAAKVSFQEHSKSSGSGVGAGGSQGKLKMPGEAQSQQGQLDMLRAQVTSSASMVSSSPSIMPTTSAKPDPMSMDSMGMGGGTLPGVDSPSSLHSPGGSSVVDFNVAALETFLFEQGMPSTPGGSVSQQGGMDSSVDMPPLSSPFNINNISLDPVPVSTSPLSDLTMGSALPQQHPPSSSSSSLCLTNGGGTVLGNGVPSLHAGGGMISDAQGTHTSVAVNAASTLCNPAVPVTSDMPQQFPGSHQALSSLSFMSPAGSSVQIKTEPGANFSSSCAVKTEPVSPSTSTTPQPSLKPVHRFNSCETDFVDVDGIMKEVRQTPSETRRLLIEQVKKLCGMSCRVLLQGGHIRGRLYILLCAKYVITIAFFILFFFFLRS